MVRALERPAQCCLDGLVRQEVAVASVAQGAGVGVAEKHAAVPVANDQALARLVDRLDEELQERCRPLHLAESQEVAGTVVGLCGATYSCASRGVSQLKLPPRLPAGSTWRW